MNLINKYISGLRCGGLKGHIFKYEVTPVTYGVFAGMHFGVCKKCKWKYYITKPSDKLKKSGLL